MEYMRAFLCITIVVFASFMVPVTGLTDAAAPAVRLVRTVEGLKGFRETRVHPTRYVLSSSAGFPVTPAIYDIQASAVIPFPSIKSLDGLPQEPVLPGGKEHAYRKSSLILKGEYFSWSGAELVYYDGEKGKAGIFLEKHASIKTLQAEPKCPQCGGNTALVEQYGRYLCKSCRKYVPEDSYLKNVSIPHYAEVDLKGPSVKRLHEMKHEGFAPGEQEGVIPLGVDPSGRYLYYCNRIYFYRQEKTTGHILLYRASTSSGAVDWKYEIAVPVRVKGKAPLTYSMNYMASDDMSRILFWEYDEAGDGGRGQLANPPAQAYVVNTTTRSHFTVPGLLTCYGQAFDRDGKYLVMGSNQTGELVRVDLAKKAIDLRVIGARSLFKLVVSPRQRHLYAFNKSSIEVRRWPDLALEKTLPFGSVIPGVRVLLASESMYATADGRFAVIGVLKKSANGPWFSSDLNAGFHLLSIED